MWPLHFWHIEQGRRGEEGTRATLITGIKRKSVCTKCTIPFQNNVSTAHDLSVICLDWGYSRHGSNVWSLGGRGVRYAKSLSIQHFIDSNILQNYFIDISNKFRYIGNWYQYFIIKSGKFFFCCISIEQVGLRISETVCSEVRSHISDHRLDHR